MILFLHALFSLILATNDKSGTARHSGGENGNSIGEAGTAGSINHLYGSNIDHPNSKGDGRPMNSASKRENGGSTTNTNKGPNSKSETDHTA